MVAPQDEEVTLGTSTPFASFLRRPGARPKVERSRADLPS